MVSLYAHIFHIFFFISNNAQILEELSNVMYIHSITTAAVSTICSDDKGNC